MAGLPTYVPTLGLQAGGRLSIGHAPLYELRVNGVRVRQDWLRHVSEVTADMDVDKADSVQIALDVLVDGVATADVLDSRLFAEGNSLELLAGYETRGMVSLGRYDLMVPALSGGTSGRRVEVLGLSAAHRLMDNKLSRRFAKDVALHEIVEHVAREHKLLPAVDTVPGARGGAYIKEDGETDYHLLSRLAADASAMDGREYRWFVRWDARKRQDVLVFEPFRLDRQEQRFRFTYSYGTDGGLSTLRDFSIEPSLKSVPSKVSLVYLDRDAREEREVIVQLADPNLDPVVLWSGKRGGRFATGQRCGSTRWARPMTGVATWTSTAKPMP